MAKIVPFPANKRVASVRKLAAQLLGYRQQQSADKVLADRLKKMREALAARGIADDLVKADVEAFLAAVQSEMWRQTFMPERPHGGAA